MANIEGQADKADVPSSMLTLQMLHRQRQRKARECQLQRTDALRDQTDAMAVRLGQLEALVQGPPGLGHNMNQKLLESFDGLASHVQHLEKIFLFLDVDMLDAAIKLMVQNDGHLRNGSEHSSPSNIRTVNEPEVELSPPRPTVTEKSLGTVS